MKKHSAFSIAQTSERQSRASWNMCSRITAFRALARIISAQSFALQRKEFKNKRQHVDSEREKVSKIWWAWSKYEENLRI